jgi:hypothetical protein
MSTPSGQPANPVRVSPRFHHIYKKQVTARSRTGTGKIPEFGKRGDDERRLASRDWWIVLLRLGLTTQDLRLTTHDSRKTGRGSLRRRRERVAFCCSPIPRRCSLAAAPPLLLDGAGRWSLRRCLTRRRGASFEPFLSCFGWNPSLKLPTTNVCSRFDWKCESFVPLRCGSLTTKWCGARWELRRTLCAGINYSRVCRSSPLTARS